jgi:hypothetical protein
LDDNIPIKLVPALLAAIAWIIWVWFPARGIGADTWSTEKFGVWWMARALMALPIIALGLGFVLGGKGGASERQ